MPGATSSFQIVGTANSKVAGAYAHCYDKREYWNGYYCMNRYIGVLVFESLDSDTYDRSI